MTLLALLFTIKVAVTALMVCGPFLFFSREKLSAVLQFAVTNSILFRLYGVAILALLVSYGFGIVQTFYGEFPWSSVIVGIVSNAGATIVLTSIRAGRKNQLSAAFFGGLALLLMLSALWPEFAMTNLFTVT